MGLDISAYSQLEQLDCVFNADGEPLDPVTRERLPWDAYTQITTNSDFPERADDLEDGVYSFKQEMGFRAGSYGGYNRWREQLAQLAGYPKTPTQGLYDPGMVERYDAGACAAGQGPFYELINFSDCEGTIGSKTATKLLKDFDDFAERAKTFEEDGPMAYFLERYEDWHDAFRLAADSGAVCFH